MKLCIHFALLTLLFLVGCKKGAVSLSDVNEAPNHHKVREITFCGIAKSELIGQASWREATTGANKVPGNRRMNYRHVVAVVPASWDSSQPIPLWVTFPFDKKEVSAEIGALARALASGPITAVNVDYPDRTVGLLRGESYWQQAVADAEQKHGIMSDPRAPIVTWKPR